jgi:hypothetical protein
LYGYGNPYLGYGYGNNYYAAAPAEREIAITAMPADLSVNALTGDPLPSVHSLAMPEQDPFRQLPTLNSLSAWGLFVPGSGFVNPITGEVTNPPGELIINK